MECHAYLAGPDVFFLEGVAIGRAKKELLATVDIVGHFPFDNEFDPMLFSDAQILANTIGRANEKIMLDCCSAGRVGILLCNRSPYHGSSTDVGTAFEVGFMSALAGLKDNIAIIGYTHDGRLFEPRVIQDFFRGNEIMAFATGDLRGPDGNTIEAFGGADNSMITHAITKTVGVIVPTFEEAAGVALDAKERLSRRNKRRTHPT